MHFIVPLLLVVREVFVFQNIESPLIVKIHALGQFPLVEFVLTQNLPRVNKSILTF
jgi:hypothetical protein